MGRKPIYVLILTASLHLACSKEAPAPLPDALPSYSLASIAASGITQAAALTPGRIVSIYGKNLGPTKPCSGSADPINRETPSPLRPNQTLIETQIFPTKLCGVEVQIGGRNAGLLYVSAAQINFKVPQSAQTLGDTTIRVLYNGFAGPSVSVPLAAPLSSATAKQIAAKMWSGLQHVQWQHSYNAASGKCSFVPAQQSSQFGFKDLHYYCPQPGEDVIAESSYYPVDHADPKLLLLRFDIRPMDPYPELSVEVEHLLIQQLTKTYGTPSIPEPWYEFGVTRQEPGNAWQTGTLTIFLNRNRTHRLPSGIRTGVSLIALEDKLFEQHKAARRLDHYFQSETSLSQATLAKQLQLLFPDTDLATNTQTRQPEPDRINEEQATRLALFRLLRVSRGDPEQRAAALVAADQLVRRLARLLVIRKIIKGSENIVITDGTAELNSQLAIYGVHFGGLGHYSGDLSYDYNLLARAWKEFPATTWGQRAFLLLQQLACETTRFGCDGPNCFLAVIQKGEAFLDNYPDTPFRTSFRKEQIYHLAQANETWWSLGQATSDDISATGARTTKASSEQARQRAIDLYEQLLQLAPDSLEAQSAKLALTHLKLKLDTGSRKFFCFSC